MSSNSVDITIKSEAEGSVFFSASADDDALVVDAKNGNEQAFEILFKRHLRKILSAALGFTRVREDAEDMAQQSLQNAFVHLRTFESSFFFWLTRIAINESRIFLRRGRGQRELSIDEDSAELEAVAQRWEIPNSNPDSEATCLQQEETRILSVATKTWRPRLRRRACAAGDGGWCARSSPCG